jgi:hypothetical protein
MNRIINYIFPEIVDVLTAKRAAWQGAIAALLFSCATTYYVFFTKDFEMGKWTLIDVVLFLLIAWGIYKMSRVAAISGLALYIIERIGMFINYDVSGVVITTILIIMYVNAIRGTFAFHKFKAS